MSLLLLALGLITGLSQIHLLHTHPFSVMRYLIPAQPILWIGLPYLFLIAMSMRLRTPAVVLFCLFIGVQAWNCTRLESTYGTVASDVRESRAFVNAVDFVKFAKRPTETVTYWPHQRFAYRGEYFGLPAEETIDGPARPAPPRFPKPRSAYAAFDASGTWVVARISDAPEQNRELQNLLADLAVRHHTTLDVQTFTQQPAADCWLVARVDREGLACHSFPLK
jgi:hypothetical protein